MKTPKTQHTPRFGSAQARAAVRYAVTDTAARLAAGAGTGQIGFGFHCLGYAWDARRASETSHKWQIYCGDEFFTDLVVG